MTARRYAEATKVPVGQTQGEVKDLLRRAGADRLMIYEDNKGSAVAFEIRGRMYRLDVPRHASKNPEQEERRMWRLTLLLVKAKLEAVREGVTTIEREFLADALLPDGGTMGKWADEQLTLTYEKGKMPPQLLLIHDGRGPG